MSNKVIACDQASNDKQTSSSATKRHRRQLRRASTPIAHWPLGKQTISHVGANYYPSYYYDDNSRLSSGKNAQDGSADMINICDDSDGSGGCDKKQGACANTQLNKQSKRKLRQKSMCFGDTEDLLSPHLAAYTNFRESKSSRSVSLNRRNQQHCSAAAALNLSLKTSLFQKHKRPFGRNYEWPTANWIHNSTKPELINLDNPKIPTSFKGKLANSCVRVCLFYTSLWPSWAGNGS